MSTQGANEIGPYDNLEKFNLDDHGDHHENQRWSVVKTRFPNYEIFWRRFIVPLTNRIDPAISQGDVRWIRLRPIVPEQFEKLAVCHYSIFYYLSRAAQRRTQVSQDQPAFVDDVVYLYETCLENVHHFFGALRDLATDFNVQVDYLPKQHPHNYPRVAWDIYAYRNVLLHNPVLGRRVSDVGTWLPKIPARIKTSQQACDHLAQFRFSWKKVEKLPQHDFIAADTLLQSFEEGVSNYVNDTWGKLLMDLQTMRSQEKFIRILGLKPLLPIEAPAVPSVLQPRAASGAIVEE
jgi:predicted transcriptional regulator